MLSGELQEYGLVEGNDDRVQSQSNRISLSRQCLETLLYPLDNVKEIPRDHKLVEILRCFDLRYYENREHVCTELQLIKNNQSVYFGTQQQGDNFIIFLKDEVGRKTILAALVHVVARKLGVSQDKVFARCQQSRITLNRLDFAKLI